MGKRSATGMGSGSQDLYPFFQRRPNEGGGPISHRLVRVKAAGKFLAVVLSSDLVGCYTHWVGNRTQPCIGDGCKPCAANSESRWKGWLACWLQKENETVIAELTDATVGDVDKFFQQHRTLRGATMRLVRLGGRVNGRLVVGLSDTRLSFHSLPECPNVPAILARMWGVDRLLRMEDGPKILVASHPNAGRSAVHPSDLGGTASPQGSDADQSHPGIQVPGVSGLYAPKKA